MSLIAVFVALVVVGFLLWLVEHYVPMDPVIKRIIQIVVIFVLILWILQQFGLLGPIGDIKIR